MINYLQKPNFDWNKRLPKSENYPRHWITCVNIEVELSDGYILNIPKGTIWDGASIPSWLWWLFKPIDEGSFGDLIHDILWKDKEGQLKHFKYNIFDARKFADDERYRWRSSLAPKKKIKNVITHFFIRLIGGFFYSRQLKIPS